MFAHLNNTVHEELAPTEFYLGQNYPNPFREKTLIKYCIAYRTKVTLKVYDSEGEEIKTLVNEDQNPGTYEVGYSASHYREKGNSSEEFYLYTLEAGSYKCEKKMSLIK